MFHRFCAAVSVMLLAIPLSAQNPKTSLDEVKSKDALAALEKYAKGYSSINREYKLRHQEMLKVLIDDLNPVRADAISVNDLDEATAILRLIKEAEKLMEQDQVAPLKAAQVEPAPKSILPGLWTVSYSSKVTRHYLIRADMVVTEPATRLTGKLIPDGPGTFLLDFRDGKLERVTALGGRIVVEHFVNAADIRRGTDTVGIGIRR